MTPVRDSVYEAVLGFSSPHTKHLEQGVPQKKASPSLSDSSYHCFSCIGQIFNDVWWSGSQPALACANTTHPSLFLLGDTKDRVPNPVPFVGVVRESRYKQQKEEGNSYFGSSTIFSVFFKLLLMASIQESSPMQVRALVCECH